MALFPQWLDEMIGPSTYEDEGVVLPKRARIDFIGDGVEVTDDPVNKKTKVTITGLLTPGAANTVVYSTGAALAMGLIVNAMVDPAAAIAGTKISPNFGSQLVQTTVGVRAPYVELGSSGPTITTGAGAPASSEPDGSVYQRNNGTSGTTLYVRAGGAWTALSGGAGSGYDTADHGGGGQEVVALTGSAGVVLVRSTAALAFNATYASTGLIRTPVGADAATADPFTAIVATRNKADNGDIIVIGSRYNTDTTTDEVSFGDVDALGVSAACIEGGVFAIGTSSGASNTPIYITGDALHLGFDAAAGVPIKFGTDPAQSGAGLRFTSIGTPSTAVVSVRGGAGAADRRLVSTYWDGSRDSVTVGQYEIDATISGADTFAGFLNVVGAGTMIVSKSDFTPAAIMLGIVGVGSGAMTITTGTGAPAASAADGSVYFRINGTNGTDGIYTRQGGVWYGVGGASGSGVTWADDLSTSTDTHQYVSQITGTGNLCTVVSTTAIRWGSSSVATAGNVRFPNGTGLIQARNNADNGNVSLLGITTGDIIQVGGSGALGVSATGFVEIGSSVAAAGTVRLPNAGSVQFRNQAGSGDVPALSVDTSNVVNVGGTGSGNVALKPGNTAALTASTTVLTAGVPLDLGASQYIKAGAHPATGGLLRASNNSTIIGARNAADNADFTLMSIDAANNVHVGGGDAVFFETPGTILVLQVGGTQWLRIQSATGTTALVGRLDLLNTTDAAPAAGVARVFANLGRLHIRNSASTGGGTSVPVNVVLNGMTSQSAGAVISTLELTMTKHDGTTAVVGLINVRAPGGGEL